MLREVGFTFSDVGLTDRCDDCVVFHIAAEVANEESFKGSLVVRATATITDSLKLTLR